MIYRYINQVFKFWQIGFTGIILILLLFTANTYSQDYCSFKQCLQIGLENNYSIKIAKNDEIIDENNYSLGNAGFLPYIYSEANQSYSITDSRQVLASSPDPVEKDNAKSNALSASVNLNWTIFDGFKMFVEYKKLNEMLQMGQLNTRMSIENLVAQIGVEYYNVIQQKKRLETIRYIKNLSKERMKVAEERYRIGQESKLEFQQAKVDFNSDSSQFLNQSENLSAAIIKLNKLLAVNIDKNTSPSDSISINYFLSLTDLLKETQVNNTNLLLALTNQSISELNLKLVNSSRYPVLSLFGGATLAQSESPASSVLESNSQGWNYGASLSFTIFDGFNINRQHKNARIDIQNAELEYKEIEQEVLSTLALIYNTYQNSLKLVDLERSNLQIARNNFDIAMERYRLGNFSGLEMRDVQRAYLDAEDRLLAAQYQAKIAEISLKQISGKISDYLV